MQAVQHALLSPSLGTQRTLTSLHFGSPCSGPKVYIQASLHADELPGMLVAHELRKTLTAAEAAGELKGEIVLVPLANPIGLSQTLLHHQVGRFELGGMENFNRHYPDFFGLLKDTLADRLGPDASANQTTIRRAMHEWLDAQQPQTELQSQRLTLMRLACDADFVLDLHCDFEAVMHLYIEQPMLPALMPLAQSLGAQAVLWARGSGPLISFDEALSGPWWRLQAHFEGRFPVPLACASTTVELRGQADVSGHLARQDAQAILRFLCQAGVLSGCGDVGMPAPLCQATPLAGTQAVVAPHAGIIVFAVSPGDRVQTGDLLVTLIDPLSDQETRLNAVTDGLVYARHNLRWATTGLELCRVAGHQPIRSGDLLSP